MAKERNGQTTVNSRNAFSCHGKSSERNIFNAVRHPVLMKFNLSRQQRRQSLLSQRRLGLAVNRPSSLCTMMRSYLPDDDNDLLLMSLSNQVIFERLIHSIENQQQQVRQRCQQVRKQQAIMQQNLNVTQSNYVNNDQKQITKEHNTGKKKQNVKCQRQTSGHVYSSSHTKDLTQLIAYANPAYYYHCEMKVHDDISILQQQITKKWQHQAREHQLCNQEHSHVCSERDKQLIRCRALSCKVKQLTQKCKEDRAMLKSIVSADTNRQQILHHNRLQKNNEKEEDEENENVTQQKDVALSRQSTHMSKSSASPSSGIISQSRSRWERHLQDELYREGQTVESFRQAKVQDSYVSKHTFAQQVQWNEYQRQLQMQYAQSEKQKRRERKRLVEEKF